MSLLFRALLLLPSLALAQAPEPSAAPPRAVRDVPLLPVKFGQEVRVTTTREVHTGWVRALEPTQLRLTLPGGQQSAVPLEALTQVEVREASRESVITGVAAGGGLLVGLGAALMCGTLDNQGSNLRSGPVLFCGAIGAALGATLGGTVTYLATREPWGWKPVWRR